MFKRTAVPTVGPSEHQARQPLNMALGLTNRHFAFLLGIIASCYRALDANMQ